MRPLIVVLAIAAFVGVSCLWLWIEDRGDEREAARAARESAERHALRAAELGAVEAEEAAFQRQLMKVLDLAEGYCFAAHERMPERPVPPTLAAGEPPHLNPEVGADD